MSGADVELLVPFEEHGPYVWAPLRQSGDSLYSLVADTFSGDQGEFEFQEVPVGDFILMGMKFFADSIGLRFAWVPVRSHVRRDTLVVVNLPEVCEWHTDAQRTGLCPKCGQRDYVVQILYGEPSDLGFAQYDRGEVWIGGCVHDEYCEPKWYCKRDRMEF